ncbi:hypothetical protein SAMN05192570_2370 [Brevundimonas viscosa]|uniref:Uncharacterized protein n=1 Tax=Brevundimonas viscosa TaxID=871741 RepID=A0A1I6SFV1_9CAUL|nr:hypothetical protein SAMN05192570_2370 [Brevundimonas viscosa]
MTPINPWIPTGSVALLIMIASCAASPPTSATPPRIALPTEATTPCRLDRLPDQPTLADLEAGYVARGAGIVACDAARRMAVETLEAERALQDRWRAGTAGRGRNR